MNWRAGYARAQAAAGHVLVWLAVVAVGLLVWRIAFGMSHQAESKAEVRLPLDAWECTAWQMRKMGGPNCMRWELREVDWLESDPGIKGDY